MNPTDPQRRGRKPRTIVTRKDSGERLLLLSPAGAGDPVVLTLCDADGNLHLLQPDAIRVELIGRMSPAELLKGGHARRSDCSEKGGGRLAGFTDRARKVMRLAEAACAEQGAGELSSEHILAGLIDEGSGVGSVVLRDRLPVDVKALRAAALSEGTSLADSARVIEASRAVASRLAFDYIGSEVLLIALAATEGLRSATLLAESGADSTEVESEVLDYLGRS